MPVDENWETECPRSDDRQHCNCWYDGKPCCRCGVAMNFGQATKLMQDAEGARARRSGWNGKGMFLFYVKPSDWTLTNGHTDNFPLLPFIAMKTADDKIVPWLASQTDVLANDWEMC